MLVAERPVRVRFPAVAEQRRSIGAVSFASASAEMPSVSRPHRTNCGKKAKERPTGRRRLLRRSSLGAAR